MTSLASVSRLKPSGLTSDFDGSETLFEQIATDLLEKGYSIRPNALPEALANALADTLTTLPDAEFKRAGIGRKSDHDINNFVRTDEICWITGTSEATQAWLDWTARLQQHLNRRLFLGLFSFESHFAHYAPGDFYKLHSDAFKGEQNRILSTVTYLNRHWQSDDGGELVLQLSDSLDDTLKVTPSFGTLVIFLSEEFPHQVLPATRDRYSIAGWFRVNSSSAERVDPPR